MDDVKDFVKKYWPYILGGVVGLYLLLRYNAGGSTSSGDGGYGAYLQTQAQMAQQNAASQAAAQTAANQLALQNKAIDAQIAYDNAALQVTRDANAATAFNQFQTAQAAMAGAVGSSTAQLIDALNKPAMTAMEAGAYENAAALGAAGNVAANSFLAQGSIVSSAVGAANAVGNMMGGVAQAMAGMEGGEMQGKYTGLINSGARAYGAYASGGMSEAFRNDGATGGGRSGGTDLYGQPIVNMGQTGRSGMYDGNYGYGSTLGGSGMTAPKYAGSAWGGV